MGDCCPGDTFLGTSFWTLGLNYFRSVSCLITLLWMVLVRSLHSWYTLWSMWEVIHFSMYVSLSIIQRHQKAWPTTQNGWQLSPKWAATLRQETSLSSLTGPRAHTAKGSLATLTHTWVATVLTWAVTILFCHLWWLLELPLCLQWGPSSHCPSSDCTGPHFLS